MAVNLLVAHDEEDTGVYGSVIDSQTVEVCVLKSSLEPHELLNEGHVWVDASSSLFDTLITGLVGDSFSQDHIRDDNGG